MRHGTTEQPIHGDFGTTSRKVLEKTRSGRGVPLDYGDSAPGITSSNGDLADEVVSLGNRIAEPDVATLGVLDAVRHQLCLPLSLAVAMLVGVVLRRDGNTGVAGRKVRDDIAPALVVVNTQGDDKVLVGVGLEAKGAIGPAAANREHISSIDLAPRSAVPDRLLDDAEECVRVGLVNLYCD